MKFWGFATYKLVHLKVVERFGKGLLFLATIDKEFADKEFRSDVDSGSSVDNPCSSRASISWLYAAMMVSTNEVDF